MGGDGVIETSKVVFAAITKQKNEDGNNQRIECDESPVSYHALCIPNNGSTVQRFLFTTYVQHYIRKTNIKMKKGGGNRIYNPRGLD